MIKYFIIYLIVSITLFVSCSNKMHQYKFLSTYTYYHVGYDNNNKQIIDTVEIGYDNMYIIDSIKIENPIWLWTDNYRFVMPERVYELYDGNEMFFFTHPEVFLYQDLFPLSTPLEIWEKYVPFMCDSYDFFELPKKNGINSVYKFESEPKFFLFILINGYFYNMHIPEHTHPLFSANASVLICNISD